MELAAADKPCVSQTEQRDVEGALQSMLCDPGHRRRGGSRECSLQEPDGLAGESCEPPGKARLFETAHCGRESLLIARRKFHGASS